MKLRLCALALVIGFAANAEEKKIYKYTDENGVTHYTESPPDERYKEAELKPLSVLPSTPARPQVSQSNDPGGSNSAISESETQAVVNEFKLIKPVPEENLWGTGGTVTAEVSPLNEAQKAIYMVQFVLDGKEQKPSNKSTQTMSEVFRGEHTLYAKLLLKDSGEEIKRTQKVTFFVHQSSKK